MFLRAKRMGIDTYNEAVVYIRKEHILRPSLGLHILEKVRVKRGKVEILGVLHAVDDEFLSLNEVGLSNYACRKLGVSDGDRVEVEPFYYPLSFDFVKERILKRRRFTKEEIRRIAEDISRGRYSGVELTAFVISVHLFPFSDEELVWFIEEVVRNGKQLKHKTHPVADKHCIGGIPGNRTSLIVVPIIAEYGFVIPKTSSRAITSPAGTADTMEVFADVEKSISDVKRILRRERGCIVWGGYLDFAPADDVIISVERPLSLDVESLMISSILAKKKSAGSTHLVIDIPVGPFAKVKSFEKGKGLADRVKRVAELMGMSCEVLITDGSAHIGRGIGPVREAFDVLSVLRNEKDAPFDLKEKSITIAGKLIELCEGGGDGIEKAREILESGRAYEKFERIRSAQGRREGPVKRGYGFEVRAEHGGTVRAINTSYLSSLAKYAGAPRDKFAGAEVFVKPGDKVKAKDILAVFYSSNKSSLELIKKVFKDKNPFIIDG